MRVYMCMRACVYLVHKYLFFLKKIVNYREMYAVHLPSVGGRHIRT